MGSVQVPAGAYWGAQTQRALAHFAIGQGPGPALRFHPALVRALARVKLAAARVNRELGALDASTADAIAQAAGEVIAGHWAEQFPLSVFISGSGTQFNMNVNEVLANRAAQLLGAEAGSRRVHPNDHVNRSQSTNDTFPTAMHLAALDVIADSLLPELRALHDALAALAARYATVVKIGRTHLQDAVPMTLGQEIGAWAAQVRRGTAGVEAALAALAELPIGGTAVGTGLNAPPEFAARMVAELSALTGRALREAPDKFEGLAAHEALAAASAALRTLAGALMKIANDVRWLGSGPRGGLGELELPANEPGSSVMPGKVNPTQSEALTQVAVQVYGHDAAVAFAASQGNFQLNVYKPVLIHNVLAAADLLRDGCRSFRIHCLDGLRPNTERLAAHVRASLALVTALAPHIGYDRAAEIAHHAHAEGTSLREAALALGAVSGEDFDRWVNPERMARGEE
jgi:fumarate hydratase class II